MQDFARHVLLIVVASFLSWWVLLRPPVNQSVPARDPVQAPPSIALTPVLEPPSPDPASTLEAVPEAVPNEAPVADVPAPLPAELGAPEGEGEVASAASGEAEDEVGDEDREDPSEEAREELAEAAAVSTDEGRAVDELMADADLLSSARSEVAGETRKGFATVLLASPEDQLDIARFFNEPLVLVPRDNLNPESESPTYFRIDATSSTHVQTIAGRAPLEGYRQYRDLFDYEYARLDEPIRELRRGVVARNEIFLFAALIPVEEWAVIIGRRREALAQSGRELADVQRFVLRYVERPTGGFDLIVEEIVFTDGGRHRPPVTPRTHGG